MMRPLLAALVLAAGTASAAFAQDATIDRPDDIEFAKALVEHDYPDLAERFLGMLVRRDKRGDDAMPAVRLALLDGDDARAPGPERSTRTFNVTKDRSDTDPVAI